MKVYTYILIVCLIISSVNIYAAKENTNTILNEHNEICSFFHLDSTILYAIDGQMNAYTYIEVSYTGDEAINYPTFTLVLDDTFEVVVQHNETLFLIAKEHGSIKIDFPLLYKVDKELLPEKLNSKIVISNLNEEFTCEFDIVLILKGTQEEMVDCNLFTFEDTALYIYTTQFADSVNIKFYFNGEHLIAYPTIEIIPNDTSHIVIDDYYILSLFMPIDTVELNFSIRYKTSKNELPEIIPAQVYIFNPSVNLDCSIPITIHTGNSTNISQNIESLFNIYPNPSSDVLQVKNVTDNPTYIEIRDINGLVCLMKELTPGINIIELSYISSGFYSALLRNAKHQILHKQKLMITR